MAYTDEQVNNLVINKLSQQQYNTLKGEGKLSDNELYLTNDSNTDSLPLFHSFYSPNEVNSLSYIKATGEFLPADQYPEAYNELLTKSGVKLSTDTYDDYDFVINKENHSFRLPLLDGSEDILSNEDINYSLPTKSGQSYTANFNGEVFVYIKTTAINQFLRVKNAVTGLFNEKRNPITNNVMDVSIPVKKGDTFIVTADVIKNVDFVKLIKATGNGSLYFKIANTPTNTALANLMYTPSDSNILLTSKYFTEKIYDISYLQGGITATQNEYPSVYEALQAEYNTNIPTGTPIDLPSGAKYIKRGVSVKLSTDSDITDYDHVLNTSNSTFKLAVTTKERVLVKHITSNNQWCDIYSDGWCEQGGYSATAWTSGAAVTVTLLIPYKDTSYFAIWNCSNGTLSSNVVNRTTSSFGKSGNQGSDSWQTKGYTTVNTSDWNGALYYFVGNTANVSGIVNAGIIAHNKANTDLSNVPANKGILVESYVNGTSWYRVYSDKWCEQGGSYYNSTTNIAVAQTVTLLKPYKNNTYTITLGTRGVHDTGHWLPGVEFTTVTTTKFVVYGPSNSTSVNNHFSWHTAGYIN